ncbi:putative molybdenum cofactor biosynthetic protein [Phaeomoniella chlamydospora]|uniref:Putative molybdenum cofactor biosynthetic protein n=1 Tax=Phaeomoniella chlamydospora TaxID=158046 RepID=A0A0G2EW63_PHACM|nr:putative molybdenum cofactor biosynthetic protein [Phaeomoniella chlamydospora]
MQPESSPQHISSTKLLSDLATTNKPPPSSSHLKRKRTPVQHPSFIPAHPLSTSRYTRQLILPQISLAGQRSLSQSRILIIGLGGLGCPASLYLAAAGLGTLGLLDSDTVELSNLHRQVLHRENSVGWTKARSAIRGLREINSKISYRAYEEPFLPSNAIRIASQYDLLLDCTDNPQTRYLINDVAVALSKTVVSAAAQRMEGQCMILNSPVDKGPCYRCIFPRPPKAEMVVSCEEVGVLGPAVGTMGVIMASEAIRVIVQQQQQQQESSPTTIKEPERKPAMLLYNAWAETMFRTIRLRNKRLDCISCGNPSHLKEGEEKITAEAIQNGGVDYVTFCGTREEVMILKDEERIDAKSFLCDILDHHDEEQEQETNPKPTTPNPLIIDVRESHEYALGPKIKSSINIPISTILRTTSSSSSSFSFSSSSASTNPELRSLLLSHLNPESHTQLQSLIFLCPRGNDSQIAARKFSEELRHVFDPTTTTTTTSIPVAVDDDNDVDDGNGNGIPDKGLFIGDVKGGWEALLKEDLLGGGGAGKGALGS